jgi:hypothetical protein
MAPNSSRRQTLLARRWGSFFRRNPSSSMGQPHGSVMTGHRTLLSREICYAAFEAAKFEQGDTPL